MSGTVTQNQGASGSRANVDRSNADDLAEIDLLGLMMAVLRRWKLCAAIVCAAILAGLVYCWQTPTLYQTACRVFVDTATLKTTLKDEAQLALTSDILSEVQQAVTLDQHSDSLAKLRSRFVAKEVPKTSLIEISYKDADAVRAAEVTQAAAEAYVRKVQIRMENYKELNEKNSPILESGAAVRQIQLQLEEVKAKRLKEGFEATEDPLMMLAMQRPPVSPFIAVPASADFATATPAKTKIMAVLVLAALVLSVLVCVVLELLDRTVKNRGEVERASGLPVLGEIRQTAGVEDGAVWRKVAALLGLGGSAKTLVVTSPSALSTMVSAAVRLAAACAENGKKVLLAELGANKDLITLMKNNGISGGLCDAKQLRPAVPTVSGYGFRSNV